MQGFLNRGGKISTYMYAQRRGTIYAHVYVDIAPTVQKALTIIAY